MGLSARAVTGGGWWQSMRPLDERDEGDDASCLASDIVGTFLLAVARQSALPSDRGA